MFYILDLMWEMNARNVMNIIFYEAYTLIEVPRYVHSKPKLLE